MNFKRYYESKNLLNEAEPPQQIYVTATVTRYGYEVSLPSGTYTVSGGDSTTFTKTKVGTTYGTAVDLSTSRTLVLEENGYILIYALPADKFDSVNVMLNTGSTPLPYEPYSSEVWHDTPHYIHNTSTDTITTLPAVIHPTGTTATVGLKGNTLQSSIPSPTSPVMPQGTGDLETSGAKAGQYKIPISSAGQTTPIYLGEVQTTRRVKKKVFDGSENWRLSGGNLYSDAIDNDALVNQVCRCTHFTSSGSAGIYVSVGANRLKLFSTAFPEGVTNATTMIAWVTQQYNNGTPLTVWYVLATETTGIVNEPIRKIGDYADEVSGITIPTIAGANTISVDTTLQPSEVSVNYKGWHPVANVHEAENGQWD